LIISVSIFKLGVTAGAAARGAVLVATVVSVTALVPVAAAVPVMAAVPVLAAMSVANRNLEPYSIYQGNPATLVKQRVIVE
jgi:predicted MFS family arabinose efflux permease